MMQIQTPAIAAKAATVSYTQTVKCDNGFPVEVFPTPIREYITENKTYRGWSKDHSGLTTLMAASSSIGNTHQIENQGFKVSPVLFGVLVGVSGTAKSPSAKRPYEKIIEQHKFLSSEYKEVMKEYKLKLAEWKRDKSLPIPEEPKFEKKFIAGSITVPALAQALSNSPRSITLFHDEIADFIDGITKNTKDDYLKFFDCDVYTRDVKGEDIFVDLPFVNIIGTTQPSRLDVFAKNKGIGSGFSYRFLYSYPEETEPMFVLGEVSQHILDNYDAIISKLVHQLYLSIDTNGNPSPRVLKLSSQAQIIYDKWRLDFLQQPAFDDVEIGIRNKLHNYSLRFCLILQLIYWAAGEEGKDEVGLRAVSGAIRLTEYFLSSSIRVHSLISNGKHGQSQSITHRELEVIELYNEGYTYSEIAEIMNISQQKIKPTLHSNKALLTQESKQRLRV